MLLQNNSILNFAMKNLKYRVYSVSSQSKEFPARNLMDSEDGWQSQISPTYPQQITIQFFVPIKTSSIKLIFHQYKIPKLVEVFVKTSKIQKFRKLGFVKPYDNSQSGYQDKEIKTIYFEFPCSFIKLVFSENYKNDYNIFNQIAIQDLSVQGQILSAEELRNLEFNAEETEGQSEQQTQQKRNQHQNSQNAQLRNNSSTSSPFFLEIFRVLQNQKKQAVDREDFQKAANLKGKITHFKNLERDLIVLEQEKQSAIQRQDFDRCHQLKIQISRKKQQVEFQISSLQQNESNYYSRISENRNPSVIYNQQTPQDSKTNRNRKDYALIDYDNQVIPAIKNKKNTNAVLNNNSVLDGQLNSVSKINQSRQYYEQQNSQAPFSAQVSNINSQNQQTEQKKQQLDPLDHKVYLKLKNYFDVIEQEDWKRVVKKSWRTRQHALTNVNNQYKRIQDPRVFEACFQFLSFTFDDSNPTVVNSSLSLLQKLIHSQIRISEHIPYHIEEIVQALIKMFIDTNQIKKNTAKRLYVDLPQILPISSVIGILIKNKQKTKLDPRLLSAKMQIMDELIQKYHTSIKSFDQMFLWVVPFCQDPNIDVRNNTGVVIRRFYEIIEQDKMIQLLKMTKQSVRETVIMHFGSLKEYGFKQGSKFPSNDSYAFDAELSKNDSLNFGSASVKRSRQNQKQPKTKSQISSKLISKNQFVPDYKQSALHYLAQSPVIPIPKGMKQSQEIDLAYSQQSILADVSDRGGYYKNNQSGNYWQGPEQSYRQSQDEIHVMEVNQNECDFCYQTIDCDQKTHLKEACPSLIRCQNCEARIYIREMTDHLLDQCSKHLQSDSQNDQVKYYQQCTKCFLAFQLSEINHHRAFNSCVPPRNQKQRCQFCAQDINPNDIAWAQHAKICRQLPGRSFRNIK